MTSTTSSPKSLLLVKAADSADFGEGRNQPETLRFCDPSDPWTPWTSSFPAVAAVRLSSLTPYHLVMTNSLPWEDPPFLFKNGKPSISMGHLYHGYVSHNQRVSIWHTNLQEDSSHFPPHFWRKKPCYSDIFFPMKWPFHDGCYSQLGHPF